MFTYFSLFSYSKIVSTITSVFTSCFAFHWAAFFPDTPLQYPPAFDGRVVLYPTQRILRDYLCWRQADCHINNLYNTVFWALVQDAGLTKMDAQERLKGTNSGDKNEILFSQFGINYNSLPQLFRKGTIVIRAPVAPENTVVNAGVAGGDKKRAAAIKKDRPLLVLHEDIIRDDFWKAYPDILGVNQEE